MKNSKKVQDEGCDSFITIKINVTEDLSKEIDHFVIYSDDDVESLIPFYNKGYNIIAIDEGESMVPKERVFNPVENPKHEVFLEMLCDMATTPSTILSYVSKETLDFFISSDIAKSDSDDDKDEV